MALEDQTNIVITVGRVPDDVSNTTTEDYYPKPNARFMLLSEGAGFRYCEVRMTDGQPPIPLGWIGTVFQYLEAGNNDHPLPNNEDGTPRDNPTVERLYARATILGADIDVWFIEPDPARDDATILCVAQELVQPNQTGGHDGNGN